MWTRLALATSVLALLLLGVAIGLAGGAQPPFYGNQSSQADLKIVRAWYGSASDPSKGLDVTRIVAAALARRDPSISVSNSTFGDVASGEHKKLWVKYTVRRREDVVIIDEDGVLEFSSLLRQAAAGWTGSANAARTVVIPIPATSLAYSNRLQKLFATVGNGGPGGMANSLVQINPATGAIERSVYIGSDPSKATVGWEDKKLFVMFADGQWAVSVDLDSFKAGIPFTAGSGKVVGMFSLPSSSNGVLVERKSGDYAYELQSYVDGKAAGAAAPCHLQTVPTINSNRLYTYDSQISPSGSGQLIALPNLAFSTHRGSPPFQGNIGLVGTVCGLTVASQGTVFDAETNLVAGTLQTGSGAALAVDTIRPQVYCLEGDRNGMKLGIYALDRFSKIADLNIGGGVSGEGSNLIRWADNGIAFLQGDKIVCSQLNLGPVASPVDLSIERSKPSRPFEAGSVVSYKLTVSNRGPSASANAVVTEVLPPGVTVQSAASSQGQVAIGDGNLQATLGSVPSNGQIIIDVKVRVERLDKPYFVAVVRSFDFDPNTTNNLALPFGINPVSGGEVKAAGPDLLVKLDDVGQRSNGSGVNLESWVVGKATITNQGSLPSKRCLARFYLEEGPRLYLPAALLIQEVEVPEIKAGGSFTLPLNIPLGGSDATGSWFIATVDPTHVSNDTNSDNNEDSMRL